MRGEAVPTPRPFSFPVGPRSAALLREAGSSAVCNSCSTGNRLENADRAAGGWQAGHWFARRLRCRQWPAKRLRDKLPQEQFDRFRTAVLVKFDGTARDMIANLVKLPVPSLIHFSDYLKGGFDKEYPDHLPPRPSFGTSAELRAFIDKAHSLGHMIMPYTNPTWWCDHPRGPTFVQAGEGPPARKLDGKPYHEVYGRNDGCTTTPGHTWSRRPTGRHAPFSRRISR